jgi:hypothetical protein
MAGIANATTETEEHDRRIVKSRKRDKQYREPTPAEKMELFYEHANLTPWLRQSIRGLDSD